MRGGDPRSFRIAVIADDVMNAAEGPLADLRERIEDKGYGILALPPHAAGASHASLLVYIVDQIDDFLKAGYRVVWLRPAGEDDHMTSDLERDLARRGIHIAPETAAVGGIPVVELNRLAGVSGTA